jgi:hypothetical protein
MREGANAPVAPKRGASMADGTFTLTIEMGSAAMQTAEDIGETLHDIATDVLSGRTNGVVRDVNGNTVGEYGIQVEA